MVTPSRKLTAAAPVLQNITNGTFPSPICWSSHPLLSPFRFLSLAHLRNETKDSKGLLSMYVLPNVGLQTDMQVCTPPTHSNCPPI